MIKEFIFKKFFLIAKLIIYTGVALCIYAGLAKRENSKKISNDAMKDNTDIRENNITNNNEKKSKNTGINGRWSDSSCSRNYSISLRGCDNNCIYIRFDTP